MTISLPEAIIGDFRLLFSPPPRSQQQGDRETLKKDAVNKVQALSRISGGILYSVGASLLYWLLAGTVTILLPFALIGAAGGYYLAKSTLSGDLAQNKNFQYIGMAVGALVGMLLWSSMGQGLIVFLAVNAVAFVSGYQHSMAKMVSSSSTYLSGILKNPDSALAGVVLKGELYGRIAIYQIRAWFKGESCPAQVAYGADELRQALTTVSNVAAKLSESQTQAEIEQSSLVVADQLGFYKSNS